MFLSLSSSVWSAFNTIKKLTKHFWHSFCILLKELLCYIVYSVSLCVSTEALDEMVNKQISIIILINLDEFFTLG